MAIEIMEYENTLLRAMAVSSIDQHSQWLQCHLCHVDQRAAASFASKPKGLQPP
jgi:hypothetical protein